MLFFFFARDDDDDDDGQYMILPFRLVNSLSLSGLFLRLFLLLISSMSLQYNDAINACEVMKPCVCSWQKKKQKNCSERSRGRFFLSVNPRCKTCHTECGG